ncbi:MAG: hypothetical protein IPH35_28075 [Rhodoferax sp.]|nr:hypothetical protein [Rhodoferax sp.]
MAIFIQIYPKAANGAETGAHGGIFLRAVLGAQWVQCPAYGTFGFAFRQAAKGAAFLSPTAQATH